MHPEIRFFPSKQFYQNKIEDSGSLKSREMRLGLQKLEEILNKNRILFLDIVNSNESSIEKSKINRDEAELTKYLVQ